MAQSLTHDVLILGAGLAAEAVSELRAWADGAPLATTAKDAVRAGPDVRSLLWWRDVTVSVDGLNDALAAIG